jgi:hypothetical protein
VGAWADGVGDLERVVEMDLDRQEWSGSSSRIVVYF